MAELSQLIALLMTVSETICNEGNYAAISMPGEGGNTILRTAKILQKNMLHEIHIICV